MTLMFSIHHQQHHAGLLSITGAAPDLAYRWQHDADVEGALRPTRDAPAALTG